jgi:hypothetical protein
MSLGNKNVEIVRLLLEYQIQIARARQVAGAWETASWVRCVASYRRQPPGPSLHPCRSSHEYLQLLALNVDDQETFSLIMQVGVHALY